MIPKVETNQPENVVIHFEGLGIRSSLFLALLSRFLIFYKERFALGALFKKSDGSDSKEKPEREFPTLPFWPKPTGSISPAVGTAEH